VARDATHAEFAALIERPEAEIDLPRAALAIARPEYAALDVESYLALLGELARAAAPRVREAASEPERVDALNHFLYRESGFAGNRADYYDVRNSYLNEVLERRVGIPITLAIVYMEVARRLGLDARGVGFPGHFLVKCVADRGASEILVDPFAGQVISREQCEQRYRALVGPDLPLTPELLQAASNRQILARVLGNLKQIHLARGDLEHALRCAERIVLLLPDAPAELRDRGLLYARLECHRAALADLERFLELAPRDPAASAIRAQLPGLRQRVASLN
jgi:regulator of sirC expression with transglutaminase-like and TPR domain